MLPQNLKIDPGYEKISTTCRELLRSGMPFDLLEYELARLSLQFLGDYKPKTEPYVPEEVVRFQMLTKQDISRMPKSDYDALESKFKSANANYSRDRSRLSAENAGSLRWLKVMLASLEKRNHPGVVGVRQMLSKHENFIGAGL